MQDKNSTNRQDWDEQFVETGWAQMRQLLDAEMPVEVPAEKERKRRFAFWWLWLGALLLFGGMSWLFFMKPDVPMQQTEVAEFGSTKDETRNTNDEVGSAEIIGSQESGSKRQESGVESRESIVGEQEAGSKIQESRVVNQTTDNSEAVENSTELTITNKQRGTTNNQPVINETNSTISHQQIPISVPSEVVAQTPVTALPLLAASDRTTLASDRVTDLPIDVNWTGKKWQLGLSVFAGMQSEHFVQIDGQTMGILAHVQRKGSKWAIESGLLYVHLLKNQTAGGQSLDDFSNAIGPSTNDPIGPNTESVQVDQLSNTEPAFLRTSISELHYLMIPVAARYQLSDRFFIQGGLAFSYLSNGNTLEVESVQDNNPLGIATQEYRLNQATINSLSTDTDLPLQRLDWSSQLGVSYYPWHRFGVHLSYNHSWESYIKTTDDNLKSYNRYWQLGVSYRFK